MVADSKFATPEEDEWCPFPLSPAKVWRLSPVQAPLLGECMLGWVHCGECGRGDQYCSCYAEKRDKRSKKIVLSHDTLLCFKKNGLHCFY